MTIHTVTSYEEDLNLLTSSVCEMGSLLLNLLQLLYNTIQTHDLNQLEEAQNIDKRINEFDQQIEDKAESLIALRQPMSIDLRHIISSLKLAVIMERMGDLAKNTVKRACHTDHLYSDYIKEDIDSIFETLKVMLSNALQAYRKLDEKLALRVCIKDKEVDEKYHQVLKKLQSKISKDEAQVESISQAMFSLKNIERIGDYISKTAQMVPYIINGKKVTKSDIKKLIIDKSW